MTNSKTTKFIVNQGFSVEGEYGGWRPYAKGDIVKIICDENGDPLSYTWRKRVKEGTAVKVGAKNDKLNPDDKKGTEKEAKEKNPKENKTSK